MDYLNDKNIRLAALITSGFNAVIILLSFVIITTIFSVASVVHIIHWISVLATVAIVGYMGNRIFQKKHTLTKHGKIFFACEIVSLFLGIVWIAKIFKAMSLVGGFISFSSSFLGYSSFDVIERLAYGIGSSDGFVILLIVMLLYFAANVTTFVIAFKFSIFAEDGEGSAIRSSKGVEMIKLIDADGKEIVMPKTDAMGMDLSKYTVEVIESEKDTVSGGNNISGAVGSAGAKAGEFLKTPKGKKTLIGSGVTILLVVLGFIFIPMIFAKTVDVTDNLDIQYAGSEGSGRVEMIKYKISEVEDDEVRSFLYNVSYEVVSKNSDLKKGDEITIKAIYNEALAKEKGLKIKGVERTIEVPELPKPILSEKDLPDTLLKDYKEAAEEKVDEWKSYLAGDEGDADDIDEEFNSAYIVANERDQEGDVFLVYTATGKFPGLLLDKDREQTRVLVIKFDNVSSTSVPSDAHKYVSNFELEGVTLEEAVESNLIKNQAVETLVKVK